MRVEEMMMRDISLNLRRWVHVHEDNRYIFETYGYWYSFWYEDDPFDRYTHGVVQMRRFDIETNDQISVWSNCRDIKHFCEKWPTHHMSLPSERVVESCQ
jgi:hypothetical protein